MKIKYNLTWFDASVLMYAGVFEPYVIPRTRATDSAASGETGRIGKKG